MNFKLWKRIGAWMLALVICIGTAAPALAAEGSEVI